MSVNDHMNTTLTKINLVIFFFLRVVTVQINIMSLPVCMALDKC